jgi:hypothetical protein
VFEAGAVQPDSLHQAAGLAGLIGRVVEAVLERGGAAVDDQDLLRPLPLELEPVGIVALAQGGRGLGGIGQDHLHAIGDGAGDVPHGLRLRDDDGLEQETGISSTRQRESATMSAGAGVPVIRAISPKVSPALRRPSG